MTYSNIIAPEDIYPGIGQTEPSSAVQQLVAQWLAWCSSAVQNEAGQPLIATDIAHEFEGEGDAIELLPYWPTTALVSTESRPVTGSSWSALAGVSLVTSRGVAELRSPFAFNSGTMYRAVITVGPEEAPGDVARVVYEMTVHALKGTNAETVGEARFGVDTVTKTNGPEGIATATKMLSMAPAWRDVIARYRVLGKVY